MASEYPSLVETGAYFYRHNITFTSNANRTNMQVAEILSDLGPLPGDPAPRGTGRGRGHGDADRVSPEWRPTAERFRDPRSGRVMRVWEDAAGARHYVPDDG